MNTIKRKAYWITFILTLVVSVTIQAQCVHFSDKSPTGDWDCDNVDNQNDWDDDNDGILDVDEGFGTTLSIDIDGDGSPDNIASDLDMDGLENWFDLDSDGDECVDAVEGTQKDLNGLTVLARYYAPFDPSHLFLNGPVDSNGVVQPPTFSFSNGVNQFHQEQSLVPGGNAASFNQNGVPQDLTIENGSTTPVSFTLDISTTDGLTNASGNDNSDEILYYWLLGDNQSQDASTPVNSGYGVRIEEYNTTNRSTYSYPDPSNPATNIAYPNFSPHTNTLIVDPTNLADNIKNHAGSNPHPFVTYGTAFGEQIPYEYEYTVYAQHNHQACRYTHHQATLTVFTVVAMQDETICSGQPINLEALDFGETGNVTYEWTNDVDTTVLNGQNHTVNPITTTTYTVTVTDDMGDGPGSNDLITTDTVKVTVSPPASGVYGTLDLCEDTTPSSSNVITESQLKTVLRAENPGGFWTAKDKNDTTIPLPGFPSTNFDASGLTEALSPYIFTYTIPATGACPEVSTDVVVNISKQKNAGIPGAITRCEDTTSSSSNVITEANLLDELTDKSDPNPSLHVAPDTGGTWSAVNSSNVALTAVTNPFTDFDASTLTAANSPYTFTYTHEAITVSSVVLSEFNWDVDVTTAAVGPDATVSSTTAISAPGGNLGTNGLGIRGIDDTTYPDFIGLTIPGSPTFDVNDIDISIDFKKLEGEAELFRRGTGFIFAAGTSTNTDQLMITYQVGATPTTISSGPIQPVVLDGIFHTYSFRYSSVTGIGEVLVDGVVVWETPTATATPGENLYWDTTEDIIIGGVDTEGVNATVVNNAVLDNFIFKTTGVGSTEICAGASQNVDVVVQRSYAGEDAVETICEGSNFADAQALYDLLGADPNDSNIKADTDGTWSWTDKNNGTPVVLTSTDFPIDKTAGLTAANSPYTFTYTAPATLLLTDPTDPTSAPVLSDPADPTSTTEICSADTATITVSVQRSYAGEDAVETICEGSNFADAQALYDLLGADPNDSNIKADTDGTWSWTDKNNGTPVVLTSTDFPIDKTAGLTAANSPYTFTYTAPATLLLTDPTDPNSAPVLSDPADPTSTTEICSGDTATITVSVQRSYAGEDAVETICEGSNYADAQALYDLLGADPNDSNIKADTDGTWSWTDKNNGTPVVLTSTDFPIDKTAGLTAANSPYTFTYTAPATLLLTDPTDPTSAPVLSDPADPTSTTEICSGDTATITVSVQRSYAGEDAVETICEGSNYADAQALYDLLGADPKDTTIKADTDGTWSWTDKNNGTPVVLTSTDFPIDKTAGLTAANSPYTFTYTAPATLLLTDPTDPNSAPVLSDPADPTSTTEICSGDTATITVSVQRSYAGEDAVETICEGSNYADAQALYDLLGADPNDSNIKADTDGTWSWTDKNNGTPVVLTSTDFPIDKTAGLTAANSPYTFTYTAPAPLLLTDPTDPNSAPVLSDPADPTSTTEICSADTATITVSVQRSYAGEDAVETICEGSNITNAQALYDLLGADPNDSNIKADTDGTWSWTDKNNGTPVVLTSTDFPIDKTAGLTAANSPYTFTYTAPATLLLSDPTDPTSAPVLSDPADPTSTTEICSGDTATITVSVQRSYAGEDAVETICEGSNFADAQALYDLLGADPNDSNIKADTDGTWSWTDKNNGTPVVLTSTDFPVDKTAGLTAANSPYTFTYTAPATLLLTDPTDPNSAPVLSDPADPTSTTEICSGDTATITVSVQRSYAGEDGVLTVCEGSNITNAQALYDLLGADPNDSNIKADTDGTWSWTDKNNGTPVVLTSTDFPIDKTAGLTAANSPYTFTYTAPATLLLTDPTDPNSAPVLSDPADPTSTTEICSGDTATITVTVDSSTPPSFNTSFTYVNPSTYTITICEGNSSPLPSQSDDSVATTGIAPVQGTWDPLAFDNENDGAYTFVPTNNPCIATNITVNVTVIPKPVFSIQEEDSFCVDARDNVIGSPLELDTGLSTSNYDFKWYLNNVEISGQTGASIFPDQTGTYKVAVTDLRGISSPLCTPVVDETEVTKYEAPSVKASWLTEAFVESQRIAAVGTGGSGLYEFSLNSDTGPWTLNPIFNNVPSGMNTIYMRDVLGDCGTVSDDVLVIGYPKFFTPNGDGVNETWNVDPVPGGIENYIPNSFIYIYDRYGKILKKIDPTNPSKGWDGTFNGELMPSTDYWFILEYDDFTKETSVGERKQLKAHFSLKR